MDLVFSASGLTAWLVSPVLALVLMVGPLGLATYLGLRALRPAQPRVAS
jgi:hypothetical protein